MPKTFFISGHKNITDKEFKEHYIRKIEKALWEKNSMFVVGDYYGVDEKAQKYLKESDESNIKKRVVVFHMLESPRVNVGFHTIGNFQSDEERDSAATDCSDFDIAWVRPGKEGRGTHKNILRRLNPAGTYVKNITAKKKRK